MGDGRGARYEHIGSAFFAESNGVPSASVQVVLGDEISDGFAARRRRQQRHNVLGGFYATNNQHNASHEQEKASPFLRALWSSSLFRAYNQEDRGNDDATTRQQCSVEAPRIV